MNEIKQIANQLKSYFFSPDVTPDSRWVIGGLIACGALFLIGILIPLVVYVIKRKKKVIRDTSLIENIGEILRISTTIWALLLFLRFEGIPFTAMRIWLFLVLVYVIIIIIRLIRFQRKKRPLKQKEQILSDKFEKYLPQPKVKRAR